VENVKHDRIGSAGLDDARDLAAKTRSRDAPATRPAGHARRSDSRLVFHAQLSGNINGQQWP
jgi:hypothetical protein